MSILLDLGIILFLLCFMIEGYKKGFLSSLMSFLYTIFSFIVSIWMSNIVSNFIYLNWVKPNLILNVENSIINGNNDIDGIFNFLPSFIFDSINNQEVFKNEINKILSYGSHVGSRMIVESISPMIIHLIRFMVIILLLTFLSIIVKGVNKTIFKIPIISEINGALGLIFGIIKGVIVIIFLCWLFRMIIIGFGYVNNNELMEIIDNTSIFKIFYNEFLFNPLIEKF